MNHSIARARRGPTLDRRAGAVSPGAVVALLSLLVVAGILWFLLRDRPVEHAGELHVFCAAGIVPAVEPCAREYEKEYGVTIRLDSGPSGGLLNTLELQPRGDLYIPADRHFSSAARRKGLVREILPLARFRLAIAVAKGNPKGIESLSRLTGDDAITYSVTNERAAAAAKAIEVLGEARWKTLLDGARVMKPTVTEIAQDVQTATVDAALIWDTTALQFGLDVVRVPEFEEAWGWIDAAVVATSTRPTEALRFARFLSAPGKGEARFAEHGYVPVDGDAWELSPAITVFSGGVNRPAVEETIREFEEREGVTIETQYNGCGALVAQMQAGQWPDIYFACDVSFSEQVATQFQPFENVSRMNIIILVPPGNPAGIRRFEDLARPGVKVGRADEVLSALGALTRKLLVETGIYEAVARNTSATTPTAAELISQVVLGGHLDAAIVYVANAYSSLEDGKAEAIPIDHPAAFAVQPIAARKETRFPLLSERLLQAIESATSRERFEHVGFEWLYKVAAE